MAAAMLAGEQPWSIQRGPDVPPGEAAAKDCAARAAVQDGVDFLTAGRNVSVAVNGRAARLGKGSGYSDIEAAPPGAGPVYAARSR